MKKSIIWIRRNLRLIDNRVIYEAIKNSDRVYFIFLYDTDILSEFNNPNDRRLSFITNSLSHIDNILKKYNSNIILLHGKSIEEIPKIVDYLKVDNIFADCDFEINSINRDSKIAKILSDRCKLNLILDHLLIHPKEILKDDFTPFRVYTPFMKKFRSLISEKLLSSFEYNLENKLSKIDFDQESNFFLTFNNYSKEEILNKIGYKYFDDQIWKVDFSENRLKFFFENMILKYKEKRDYLDIDGTSSISPYLRFGNISIRKCFNDAFNLIETINLYEKKLSIEGINTWINELIWREFYVNIIYNFPESINLEFQSKYINKIKWNNSKEDFEKFINFSTGFPIIDASVKQLIETGWMHNRSRMIVASFLTKNLLIDWRKGETFFAKYLMDYDLASNVGGWQWSASTGTDAQPYFRVFNPILQSKKFDPDGKFIKRYLPQLSNVKADYIHDGSMIHSNYNISSYPYPMVDLSLTRNRVIEIFSKI